MYDSVAYVEQNLYIIYIGRIKTLLCLKKL